MSDFSMFSLFTAGLACLIPLSAAYTQPKGDAPKGNPISQPGLNSVVPVGEGFTIEWDPTTKGTVTLVLLKGPSSNAAPQYSIVEKTPNNGTYVWTPSTSLPPSDPSNPAEGYGIQLIDDATGQYQYTTQFGISNPKYQNGASSSSSSSSAPSYGGGSVWAAPPMYQTRTPTAPSYGNTKTMTPPAYTPSALPKPTGYKPQPSVHNVTMIAPTYSIPSSSSSSSLSSVATPYGTPTAAQNTTSPTDAPFSGGAGSLTTSFASLVFAAGIAVFAL